MLVKSELKRIRSLYQKKYRKEHGLFFVEGKKTIQELIDANIKPFKICCTSDNIFGVTDEFFTSVSKAELQQMSQLKNANGYLGVFHIPKAKKINQNNWIVALDSLQDPGNLGTIIRLCDWFGISNLICSKNTVDCYNPKVLQATMGSIARVAIDYIDLPDFLEKTELKIYGAFMKGDSIYNTKLPKKGILILGNEGNGISKNIEEIIASKISIPQFGSATTESLNVGTAAAILLNEIRRT